MSKRQRGRRYWWGL